MTGVKFLKVSKSQFLSAVSCDSAEEAYENIRLPRRATVASAGYDFFTPCDIFLSPGETTTVATGIRALMPDDCVLMIYPRSGLGFKFRMRLDNTVGVIDADYSRSDNEGHIFVRITNEGQKDLVVRAGTGFAQGIFTRYIVTEDDDATGQRNGGFGSTTK